MPHTETAVTAEEIDQRMFDMYDEYCHGKSIAASFLQRAGVVTVGGLVMANALLSR